MVWVKTESYLPYKRLLVALSWYLVCRLPLVLAEPCYLNTTTCVPVTTFNCLGSTVSFTHTTLLFSNDSSDLADVDTNLAQWSLLQGVPECWAIIQPFLCSVYLPKCDADKQRVELPNRELCERTREPCKIVTEFNGHWPEFLKCNAWFYAENCGKTVYETSNFDTTSFCNPPLIRTTDETSWYNEIKGCGVQCQNPLFTESEHEAVHVFVAVCGSLCIACTFFTLLTFIIDWKVARKYPAVIIFFINGCFFLGSIGWMAQFAHGARDDIVCRKDGTIRKGEPLIGSGESASCTVVFFLVYYCMMAGVVWFVMLAYSWHIKFKALGTVRDDLTKKAAYFHIVSWCLPLVLTIACLTISEIDGDSVSGICFAGYFNNYVRAGFVLAPIGLVLLIGMVFIIRGLCTLIHVRKDTPQFMSDKATAKIRSTILRLGIFTVLAFVFVLATFSVHIYTFTNEDKWADSFKDYIYCQANVSVTQIRNNQTVHSCDIEDRPSLIAAIVHVFAFFGAGIAMSSWSWTKQSLEAWERLFRKICNKPLNSPVKLKKRRVISKRMRRRRRDINIGRSSYGTDHDDPLGMRFDMNSHSSRSQSSGFAVAMPKRSRRQNGIMMRPIAGNLRGYSDSDITTISSRRTRSKSSRRDSYESSMSQKLSDIERDIRADERRKRRVKRKDRRRRRIQPVLEPLSSAMAALHDRRGRSLKGRHRWKSDSSERDSRDLANGIKVGMEQQNLENYSISSNILSDSTVTNSSMSDLELPQPKPTNFSMFTANTLRPVEAAKEDNSNVSMSLKGTKSSPSGSLRRGRKREVKLEVTETSFYQEDNDNIEIGGTQTIHKEENCQETAEMGPILTDIGPIVASSGSMNGLFAANRRGSGSRDPMGSGRLGSASSRGSRGSRGSRRSETNNKEIVPHASNRVALADRFDKYSPNILDGHTFGKRPHSGDYIITATKRRTPSNQGVRGSRSLPGSRETSANPHKRQIGNFDVGRMVPGNGWSRHFQSQNANQNVDVLNVAEEHKRALKRRHGGGSVGSTSGASSRQSDVVDTARNGSGSSKSSRNVRYDGINTGSASTTSSRYDPRLDQRLEQSGRLPGVDHEVNILNLVDYEDDEYSESELTTYEDYTTDDLTEVSSLPC